MTRYSFLIYLKGNLFKLLLYRYLLPVSDHVLVQTNQMKSDFYQHGIEYDKMTPIPMGVDLDAIPFFGYKYNTDQKEKKIVYLGTLVRTRGLDFLIRCFKKVLDNYKTARLYLVGGGADAKDIALIESEANRLGIKASIIITGFLPQTEAWDYVRTADVCVSPLYPIPILNCGFPTKLIEYMAMGKATVVNDHPEQRLIIKESKAGICVPFDECAFAEAIIYLLNNPREAEEMGIRGCKYVKEHKSYEQIADLLEVTLKRVSKKS